MILELEVTFPAGRFHGEEWPPAPTRLFQALVAGTHLGANSLLHRDARDAALRWLETLPPPTIAAGDAVLGCTHLDNYVPNNDDHSGPNAHVRTAKVLAAHAFSPGSILAYRWTFDDSADAARQADTISAMASLVTHLGQTTDGVFAHGQTLPDAPPADDDPRTLHLPREVPGGLWRSPAPGFFDLLRRRYPRSVSTEPPDFSNSRQVDYARAGDALAIAPAPMAIFEMLRPDGERSLRFDPRDVRQPAGMVRGALLAWANRPAVQRAFPADLLARLLAGHRAERDGKPSEHNGHFGIVPLPTLKHDGLTDGKIGRVALVGWGTDASDDARELFEEASSGLHGKELLDGGAPRGTLRGLVKPAEKYWVRFWTEPARRWRSVTPVVMPGLLRAGRAPEALLQRALAQAGHAAGTVDSVAAFRGPLVPHTLPALDYRLGDYLKTSPRYHAEVIFRRPAAGPLVLGRGRYAGVGLFMPVAEVDL